MIKIKICGITNVEDAIFCSRFADLIGVIVNVPVNSPRKIPIDRAREIFSKVSFVEKVVVTMVNDVEKTLNIVDELNPDYIQLHGNETVEIVEELRRNISCKIIKAIIVEDERSIDIAKEFERYVSAIILDSKKRNYIKGERHDWRISKEIVKHVNVPVFLAGGINEKNVIEAIKFVKPYGIDVSSGVEKYPGKKDYKRVLNLYLNIQKALIEEINSERIFKDFKLL